MKMSGEHQVPPTLPLENSSEITLETECSLDPIWTLCRTSLLLQGFESRYHSYSTLSLGKRNLPILHVHGAAVHLTELLLRIA
jgi:hypothetical protein